MQPVPLYLKISWVVIEVSEFSAATNKLRMYDMFVLKKTSKKQNIFLLFQI